MTLANFDGHNSFTINGKTLTNRASSGATPIYDISSSGGSGSGGGAGGIEGGFDIDCILSSNLGSSGAVANNPPVLSSNINLSSALNPAGGASSLTLGNVNTATVNNCLASPWVTSYGSYTQTAIGGTNGSITAPTSNNILLRDCTFYNVGDTPISDTGRASSMCYVMINNTIAQTTQGSLAIVHNLPSNWNWNAGYGYSLSCDIIIPAGKTLFLFCTRGNRQSATSYSGFLEFQTISTNPYSKSQANTANGSVDFHMTPWWAYGQLDCHFRLRIGGVLLL
jgi:hypothetical protein|tara:strand:+ start:358 stop:1200 length:843 start_codon:yes stop_codon:yes gene_type:complete